MPASSSQQDPQRDPLAVGSFVAVPQSDDQAQGQLKYRNAEITGYRSPTVVTVRFADNVVSNSFLPDVVPINHWAPFTNAIGRVHHNGTWEACRVTRATFKENSGKWIFRVEVINPAGFPKERKGILFRNLDLCDLQTSDEIKQLISKISKAHQQAHQQGGKFEVAQPEFRMDPQEDWQSASIILNKNELRILGHPVMQRWEEPYMKRLAQICCARGGTILEIGYGMGISARIISQQPKVEKHVFVEGNQQVFQNALKWTTEANRKARRSKVQGQFGFWEDLLPDMASNRLNTVKIAKTQLTHMFLSGNSIIHIFQCVQRRYDGILFDPYPFDGEHINDGSTAPAFFKQAARLNQNFKFQDYHAPNQFLHLKIAQASKPNFYSYRKVLRH